MFEKEAMPSGIASFATHKPRCKFADRLADNVDFMSESPSFLKKIKNTPYNITRA